jgi:carbon-monoxide dehydrogenase medium subunit
MKPAPFSYHAPKSMDACLHLLSKFADDSALLAGGQSLIPLMRFRLARPAVVIGIRSIGDGLSSIQVCDDAVSIGASVTYSAVQRSAEIASACPGLAKAIDLIATPAVRTRGTVCGNLCQADPASELPAMAVSGERAVAATDFFRGPYMTTRRSDEILAKVIFPRRPALESFAIEEVTRLRGGFPMAGVAIAFTRGQGTSLSTVLIACFGVHSRQIRTREAEAILQTQGYTADAIAAAADAIDRAIEPHSDSFASDAYRRSAMRTLFKRAIDKAWQQAGGGE